MSNTNTITTNLTEERINILVKDLASKRRATNWGTNLSFVVGLAALVLLCAYFYYGYRELDKITQPKKVVSAAKSYLDNLSVEARRTAAEEVKKSAPIWAQEASKELVANMPTLREKAETSIVQYIDEQLDQTKKLTSEGFTEIMANNRADFADAIKIIIEEGKSDEFVNKVLPIIEDNYAPDVKESALNTLGVIQDINRRMEKLARGQNLNEIEKQQRHILGLARLLRDQSK